MQSFIKGGNLMVGGILSKLTGVTPNGAICTQIVRRVRYCCGYSYCQSDEATCEKQYDNYGNLCG